jgi:glycosyltransferase involved in cell wall biosynthesis
MKNDLLKYSLHKKSNVSFFDRINNDKIPDLLNKYNYLMLFSLYEGNPKILLEAMSCGLCIIGSKVPGIKDIIINNQNGLIFDLDDTRIIINKISTISKNNLLLIQNNARKTIEKNFALDLTYKIELNILNSLFKN